MHTAIAQHKFAISGICKRFHIKRLEVFGSAARAVDFNPESSDADFLVEFAPDAEPGLETFLEPELHWSRPWAAVSIWWRQAQSRIPLY